MYVKQEVVTALVRLRCGHWPGAKQTPLQNKAQLMHVIYRLQHTLLGRRDASMCRGA